MKKFIALFALVAASSFAQAQTMGHPDARNDRTPAAQAAEHGDNHQAYKRAHRRHAVRHHGRRHHHRA